MSKTGNQLIADVQLTVTMPNNQVLLTDERILNFANDELSSTVQEMIMSLNQGYFIYLDETDHTIDGVQEYTIPYRAIGRVLRDLKMRNGPPGTNVWNTTLIAIEDAVTYMNSTNDFAYYFRGDMIHFASAPRTDEFQILKYYLLRPNKITKTDAAGKVLGISGNVVTIDITPQAFVAGALVDFIKGLQGNRTIAMDQVITNVSGSQITITTPPDNLEVGDWVSLAEESPVLQIPDECFTYLSLLTAKRCLGAIGDFDGAKAIADDIPEKRTLLEKILAPRAQGENIKIINRNGLLRGNRQGFWRGVLR